MKVSFKHLRPIAVVLGATAFAILSFPGNALAADPITGAWLGAGSQVTGHLHVITENGGWVEIRAAEDYALRDYSYCRVPSNQLIGRFQFTGTDQNGNRRYEGQWFSWTIPSPGVCTVSAPSGQYTASLQPGRDTFQNPPLQYGPDNMINIYEGSYPLDKGFPADVSIGFIRKSGAPPTTGPRVSSAPDYAPICESAMTAIERTHKATTLTVYGPAAQARVEWISRLTYDNGDCVGAYIFWLKAPPDMKEYRTLEWHTDTGAGRVAVSALVQQYAKDNPDLQWTPTTGH